MAARAPGVKRYRAILFDLFNTVALWRPERMPRFTLAGRTTPSTLGELARLLEAEAPALSFEAFHDALLEVNTELAERRAHDQRELASAARFAAVLTRAGHGPAANVTRLAQRLSARHMALLSAATDVPAEHVAFLERLRRCVPLALVSNFDHGVTARRIVARDGVAQYFSHVVISDGHGWRKPHPKIFEDTLGALGVSPAEALFVGDSPEDDVVGAAAAGMDVAWVNAKAGTLPDGVASPHYEIASIPELEVLLRDA